VASRQDIEAGKAHVRLYVKNSELVKGLADIQGRLQGLGRGIMAFGAMTAGLGTAIIAPLVASIFAFSSAGDALDKMSRRTGVAVETLDMLAFAAERSGTSIDTVEKAIRKAQQNGFAAEQFGAIAAEIAALGDHDAKVRRTMDIFGRQGAELIPMLEDLAGLNQEFERFGMHVDPADVKAAADLNDALGDVSGFAAKIAFQLGASLAPAIMPVLDTVKQIAAATFVWIQANGETVQLIAAIGIGLVVAGTAAIALGATLVAVGATVGSIMTLWTALTAAITFLATPLGIVVVIIGAIVAAIVAAIAAWLLFTRHGREFLGWLGKQAVEVGKALGEMFSPALKALRSGQMELAWAIVVKNMEIIWTGYVETVLTGIEQIARAYERMQPTSLVIGTPIADAIAAQRDAYMKANFDAIIARDRLAAQAGNPYPDDPNSPGYGLQDAGDLRGKVLGFSARATQLAGNVIGHQSPQQLVVSRLDAIKGVMKLHLDELKEIKRAAQRGGRFR
jgi:hypothetical protein